MSRSWLAAPLLFAVFTALEASSALAATPSAPSATQDLVAGPPAGEWQVYDQGTGPLTAADLYGDKASTVKGFVDAYQKSWHKTGEGLVDRLERFNSVFWAAFRLGGSQTAAQRNPSHSSVKKLTGLGGAVAYEITDPADAQGFLTDTIVFAYGDYVGVVSLAAVGTVPRATLVDQVDRQLNLLPLPVGEYQAIGNGILLGGAILIGAVIAIIVVAVVVVVVAYTLSRRRRSAAAGAGEVGPGLQLSPDRRYWWDGRAWQDTSMRIPPGARVSPDRTQWWDGLAWRPVPPPGA